MNKKILLAIGMLMTETTVEALNQSATGTIWVPPPPKGNSPKTKVPNYSYAIAAYNASTTALTIMFPANGQSGKVEIYRNGVKVVDATATAGANLSFVLRSYGKGNYTIIVSQGNTVVYSNSVEVKRITNSGKLENVLY